MSELLEVSGEMLDETDGRPEALPLAHRSTALHLLGRYDEQLEVGRKCRELYPDEVATWKIEAQALAALGRLDELDALLDDCTTIAAQDWSILWRGPQDQGTVLEVAARELRVHGYREESLDVAGRLVEWRKHTFIEETATKRQRVDVATAYYLAERWEEAKRLLGELAPRVVEHVDNRDHLQVMICHGSLGVIAARQGDRERALRISEDLRKITGYTFGVNTANRAMIAAQLGEGQRALDLLRQAVSEGYVISGDLHSDPDFEPLWDEPEYQELVRPKG